MLCLQAGVAQVVLSAGGEKDDGVFRSSAGHISGRLLH